MDRVATALRSAGATVYTQRDTFGTGSQDIDWLPRVGAAGWVLLTKDQNIRRRPIELHALLQASVRGFFLTAGNLRGEEQAHVFHEALPAMRRLIRRIEPPFLARVTQQSDVSRIDVEKWLAR
jgi:hypothetical protein